MRRWRTIERDSYQFEEADPTYVAKVFSDGSEEDVDGWRPLAAVWKYTYAVGDLLPKRTIGEGARGVAPIQPSEKPWRALIFAEGRVEGPRHDFAKLALAQSFVEGKIEDPSS